MSRPMLRHAFILILLALLTGAVVPSTALPHLALSAHTIGLLGGALLIGIAAVWDQFDLGTGSKRVLYFSWLHANYANWLGCVVGAMTGAGRATPIASAGAKAGAVAETTVMVLLGSSAIAALIAVGLSFYGLRAR